MNYSDYIDNLKELFGDDLIIKNNLIVGVCPCKGKGKGKCKGNGWQPLPPLRRIRMIWSPEHRQLVRLSAASLHAPAEMRLSAAYLLPSRT